MRNLKRVLSLALALVMVIGMMVIGAGAASFDDAKDIAKEEAATMMQELGIMEGDENGNFNPADVLTREQAAAMLARVILGEKGAKTVAANKVGVFTDVAADRWSAGYIAWAANQNYIAGWNGEFDPAGQLTGVAYAKLLLVALGFDPEVEGYVNNINWATNIGADAVAFGLTKNVDGLLANALTRENAAQMTLNALEATCVDYADKGFEIITADGTVIRQGVEGPYALTWDNRWDTNVDATDYDLTDGKTKDSSIQLIEKLFPGIVKTVVADERGDWGEPSEFSWVDTNPKKDKVLYTEWAEPVVEYFTAVDECDVVKDLDSKRDVEYAEYWVDGKDEGDGEWDATGKDFHYTGTGVWTRIYEVKGEYIAVAVNTYFGEVTKIVTEKTDKNGHITREAGIELDVYVEDNTADEFFFATDDEFAKGDYVIVNICDGDIYDVAVAEVATETVKRISDEDAPVMDTVKTSEGGEYGENVKFFYIFDEAKDETVNKLQTKQEYDLYFDAYGNIIAAIITKDSSNTMVGIINKIVWKDSDDYDTDGFAAANVVNMAAEDVDVDLVYNEVVDVELFDAGTGKTAGVWEDGSVNSSKQYNKAWYDILAKYEQNKDESWDIIDRAVADELTAVAPKVAGTIFSIMDDSAVDHTADNKTVFLIKTVEGRKEVYTSYTGYKAIPSMKAADGETIPVQYFVGKTGRLTYVFVDATEAIFTGSTELVYLLSDKITDEDDQLLEFKAFVGTDKETFVLSAAMAKELGVKDEGDVMGLADGLYELSFNSDDQVIDIVGTVGTFLTDVEISNGVVSELEYIDEDFDYDEVAFYAVNAAKVVEGDSDEADEAEWVQYAVNAKGAIVGVWYAEIED